MDNDVSDLFTYSFDLLSLSLPLCVGLESYSSHESGPNYNLNFIFVYTDSLKGATLKGETLINYVAANTVVNVQKHSGEWGDYNSQISSSQ